MLDASKKVVVIGAGHAGVEFAAALRQKGFAGSIDLVSDETPIPYQRPPLSKEYIKRPGNPLVLKPAQFYVDQKVTLRTGVRAEAIDRETRKVRLSDGEVLPYDHLVIATGARNRKPPVPGIDHPAVIELRSLADAERIVERIAEWRRVVVIGGGFIGLEAAGLFSLMGIEVDVVEMAPRLMARAVSPTVSAWFRDFHHDNRVQLHMPQQVAKVEHRGNRAIVTLAGGDLIEADAVLLAAGVVPNTEIAATAGLEVSNGVVVDGFLATADPAISAIGDCAAYPSVHFAGMARLESVQNAGDHGKALAARLMGDARPYDALPWFWSIQGEARLQIAGLTKPGLTEVVRGDTRGGKFSVFLFDGAKLQAVESVNAPADHMVARRLIAAGTSVDPAAAADMAIDIKSLMAA
ncbi:MAG: oxidoreductase [Rhizobiaceae bacterium]|nr:oxidoreductase [Rhizobiaceae bacterium]